MVSHKENERYTSKSLTYGTLKSALAGGGSDSSGSGADNVALYRLGEQVDVTIKENTSIQLNTTCLVVLTITGNNACDIVIDGVQCNKYNAYRSAVTTDSTGTKHFLNSYVGYSGSIVLNNARGNETISIVPFLDIDSGQLDNSEDVYYSNEFNLLDFYDAYNKNTLSTYSKLFNQLNINKNKTAFKYAECGNILYYQRFTINCTLPSEYSVVMVPVTKTAPEYYIRGSYDPVLRSTVSLTFQATNKMLKFPYVIYSNYFKMIDIDFRITITKLYTEVSE